MKQSVYTISEKSVQKLPNRDDVDPSTCRMECWGTRGISWFVHHSVWICDRNSYPVVANRVTDCARWCICSYAISVGTTLDGSFAGEVS